MDIDVMATSILSAAISQSLKIIFKRNAAVNLINSQFVLGRKWKITSIYGAAEKELLNI